MEKKRYERPTLRKMNTGLMNKFGTKVESIRPIIEYAKKEMTSQKDISKIEKGIEKIKNST